MRADLQGTDLLRLMHGLILASDWAPGDTAQADRILSMVMHGLLSPPGRKDSSR